MKAIIPALVLASVLFCIAACQSQYTDPEAQRQDADSTKIVTPWGGISIPNSHHNQSAENGPR